MAGGLKEHCLNSQGRSECTHNSCWSCWREPPSFGLCNEGYTHHVSQTVDLTKVLVAPIVDLTRVHRTLGFDYTDASDRPDPQGWQKNLLNRVIDACRAVPDASVPADVLIDEPIITSSLELVMHSVTNL